MGLVGFRLTAQGPKASIPDGFEGFIGEGGL